MSEKSVTIQIGPLQLPSVMNSSANIKKSSFLRCFALAVTIPVIGLAQETLQDKKMIWSSRAFNDLRDLHFITEDVIKEIPDGFSEFEIKQLQRLSIPPTLRRPLTNAEIEDNVLWELADDLEWEEMVAGVEELEKKNKINGKRGSRFAEILSRPDLNKDGRVSNEELAKYHEAKRKKREAEFQEWKKRETEKKIIEQTKEMRAALSDEEFNKYDADKNGVIDIIEKKYFDLVKSLKIADGGDE